MNEEQRLKIVEHAEALGIDPREVLMNGATHAGYNKMLSYQVIDGWLEHEFVEWTEEQLDYIVENKEDFIPWLYPEALMEDI